nr:hypothetical protein [Microbacterium barkeri]
MNQLNTRLIPDPSVELASARLTGRSVCVAKDAHRPAMIDVTVCGVSSNAATPPAEAS